MLRVTITGADDSVNPEDLIKISQDFPFVEWGILVSEKRRGTPRYPTHKWITSLRTPRLPHLALHLCGSSARETLLGQDQWVMMPDFERVQINGYVPGKYHGLVFIGREGFILQCRNLRDLYKVATDAEQIGASILYDVSGGLGISPANWPNIPTGARMGYAGGINETNIVHVLEEIDIDNPHTWIDLETGARDDNDQFDLDKVRQILTLVKAFHKSTS